MKKIIAICIFIISLAGVGLFLTLSGTDESEQLPEELLAYDKEESEFLEFYRNESEESLETNDDVKQMYVYIKPTKEMKNIVITRFVIYDDNTYDDRTFEVHNSFTTDNLGDYIQYNLYERKAVQVLVKITFKTANNKVVVEKLRVPKV